MNPLISKAIDIFLEFNKDHISPKYEQNIKKIVTEKLKNIDKIDSQLIHNAIVNYNIEPLAAIQYSIEKE